MPAAAAALGAAGMGTSIAGGLIMDKAKLKPAVSGYGSELKANLDAQEAIAGQKLAAERQYGNQYADLSTDLIAQHGPAYASAIRKSAGTDAIIAKLLGGAESELDAGYSLPPGLAAELSNSIRASAASRGVGFGLSDVGAEGAITAREMDAMWRARREYAMRVAGLASESVGGPAMIGAVTNQGPFFDPESQYAYGLNRANQGNIQEANRFSANKKLALGAGLMNMGGSMMGSSIGMMGG